MTNNPTPERLLPKKYSFIAGEYPDFEDMYWEDIDTAISTALRDERERMVKELIHASIDSWHEAQTLRMNLDGSVTRDIDLDKMGKIFLNKLK